MPVSLKDYCDFVLIWVKKQTGVHLGSLVVYPALVRHCLCCQRDAEYARQTFGLCEPCAAAATCCRCNRAFEPDRTSVGRYCPDCWAELESIWRDGFAEDPVRAENAVRSFVTRASPPLLGCRDHV